MKHHAAIRGLLLLALAATVTAAEKQWQTGTWGDITTSRQMDMGNFMKNLALMGGALMMLMIPTPWANSVEARRRIAV